MKYLLDTNAFIRYLNGTAIGVLNRLRDTSIDDVAVCAVVKAELFYGAAKSGNPEKTLAKQIAFLDQITSLPFDDMAAEKYSTIRAHLERQGTPIGPNDLMIASIALARDLTLVTHNAREFSRVPNLKIEDWEI